MQYTQITINKSYITTILEFNKKMTLTKSLFMVQYNYIKYLTNNPINDTVLYLILN